MSYNAEIHHAQMAATKVNEALLKAMGAEGGDREYHVKDALREFGKLSAEVRELTNPGVIECAPRTPMSEAA